jgi:hypothetical protein
VLVAMPKAAMNENDLLSSREDQIRSAREIRDVEAITKA